MKSMDQDQKISRFWDKYIELSKAYGVSQKALQWHVRHVEQYIQAQDLRLKDHTPEILVEYFQAKGRNIHFQDWQFSQMVDSLKILFSDLVKTPWACDFQWDDFKNQARQLGDTHPTIARQSVLPDAGRGESNSAFAKIKTQFKDLFEAFITEIRCRNYSIRTEQSYVAWLCRFILFNQSQHPETLNEQHIAAYLTHLAVNRMVSASTQRQALNAIIFLYKQIYGRSYEQIGSFALAKKPVRLPVVLSKNEVDRLLKGITDPVYHLMASLLYGCGMRLMECVRLRILDIDLDYQ